MSRKTPMQLIAPCMALALMSCGIPIGVATEDAPLILKDSSNSYELLLNQDVQVLDDNGKVLNQEVQVPGTPQGLYTPVQAEALAKDYANAIIGPNSGVYAQVIRGMLNKEYSQVYTEVYNRAYAHASSIRLGELGPLMPFYANMPILNAVNGEKLCPGIFPWGQSGGKLLACAEIAVQIADMKIRLAQNDLRNQHLRELYLGSSGGSSGTFDPLGYSYRLEALGSLRRAQRSYQRGW